MEIQIQRIIHPLVSFSKFILITWLMLCGLVQAMAVPVRNTDIDTTLTSSRSQALAFLNTIKDLETSKHWPNINPGQFLQNVRANIQDPVKIYPGNGTNFCGYGALSYLFLQDDPLGYAKLLLQLYSDGQATFGKTTFHPSAPIRKQAGLIRFKAILDIHPADQMWFLCLADHFKGYLNILNHKYDPGDENTFWASVNYAKFNRMVGHLLGYQTTARGADLLRPRAGNLYQYISKKMQEGPVVLFINNRIVHKKNQVTLKLGVPTHFIVVEKITNDNDLTTMVYWDYGHKTLLQLSPAFFKRIVFGITACTKIKKNA
jgi:hypothetical protein